MAMNKAEKEQLENALIRASLYYSEPVLPDIKKPEGIDYVVKGFSVIGNYVNESCSISVCHSNYRSDVTTSNGGIEQYSTRLLALRQLRHETVMKCAKMLRNVDVMIEQELIKHE